MVKNNANDYNPDFLIWASTNNEIMKRQILWLPILLGSHGYLTTRNIIKGYSLLLSSLKHGIPNLNNTQTKRWWQQQKLNDARTIIKFRQHEDGQNSNLHVTVT